MTFEAMGVSFSRYFCFLKLFCESGANFTVRIFPASRDYAASGWSRQARTPRAIPFMGIIGKE